MQVEEGQGRLTMTGKTITKHGVATLLFALVVALVSVPAACSSSTSGTTVSVYLADRNVSEGEGFSVDVKITTGTPCRGAQFGLGFDPTLMKCDGVSEGTFFKDWADANGASTLMLPQSPAIDNSRGRIPTVGIAIMGVGGGGAKGSGVLCSYQFTALVSGKVDLTLSDVVVTDDSGRSVPDVEINN